MNISCCGIPREGCCLPGPVEKADGHIKIVGEPLRCHFSSCSVEWKPDERGDKAWPLFEAEAGAQCVSLVGERSLSPREDEQEGQGDDLTLQESLVIPSSPCVAMSCPMGICWRVRREQVPRRDRPANMQKREDWS